MLPVDVNIAFVWENYGPYHHARVVAVQRVLGLDRVIPIEISSSSETYPWVNEAALCTGKVSLFENVPVEACSPVLLFFRLRRTIRRTGIRVIFVPSYWPLRSFLVLLAARLCGCRCVMMNESHAGTAKAQGFSFRAKKWILKLFHAGLVGGAPHCGYFASIGFPERSLFTGYDCVDNEFFRREADKVRADAARVRKEMGLPANYLLNIGRMVEKKNLETLVEAYSLLLKRNAAAGFHLVFIGSGEREEALKALCRSRRLPVYERRGGNDTVVPDEPGVHFMGFRQMRENAAFYALASVFVLPSRLEEWGLVVNEAMAAGLPVVVSEQAGCAEDLLPVIPPELADGFRREIGGELTLGGVRRNGCIFDPASSEELAGYLGLLISKPGLRERMAGDSARIVEQFSTANFAAQAVKAAACAMGLP